MDNAKNFSKVTLSTGYDNVATTVVLITSDGAKLPTAPFNVVWFNSTDYTDPTDDPNKEIVRVTNVTTDTLTITRAQEGTSAATHNTGGKSYKMIAGLTAKVINTDIPAMNITGTAANLSGTPALPNGTTATTQAQGDNSTNIATTSFVNNEIGNGWIPSEAATFVSTDTGTSTGVFNIASDVTAKYSVGMKYNFQQAQALTAYWTFNSDSTSQVGSFNGTDTAMTYTAGKFGNAATFNGTTSKIVIADNSSLKPTGEFTIGGYFKSGATGAIKFLFQSYSSNTNIAGIYLAIDASNHLTFVSGNNTGTALGTNYSQITGTTTVTDNALHLVDVSFRNNYLQVYLDGKLEASGYCLTPAYAATNYVRIGCANGVGSDSAFINGQIDDLFLINGYALDADTILAQYNAQAAQGTGNITVNKKALITAVGAFSGGNTPITIWGGTDYSLQNATISNPYYSTVSQPFGFNRNPAKWTVEVSNAIDQTQGSPVAGTWYNLGSISTSIPIGIWRVIAKANLYSNKAATTVIDAYCTLSTANNSESNPRMTSYALVNVASGTSAISSSLQIEDIISISTKTTYYLNSKTGTSSAASIYLLGATGPATIIRAVSTLV